MIVQKRLLQASVLALILLFAYRAADILNPSRLEESDWQRFTGAAFEIGPGDDPALKALRAHLNRHGQDAFNDTVSFMATEIETRSADPAFNLRQAGYSMIRVLREMAETGGSQLYADQRNPHIRYWNAELQYARDRLSNAVCRASDHFDQHQAEEVVVIIFYASVISGFCLDRLIEFTASREAYWQTLAILQTIKEGGWKNGMPASIAMNYERQLPPQD